MLVIGVTIALDTKKDFAFSINVDGRNFNIYHVLDRTVNKPASLIVWVDGDEFFVITYVIEKVDRALAQKHIREWIEFDDEAGQDVY